MLRNGYAKRIAADAVLAAAALIVFSVENLLPPLFLPGARLGLANIFSLLAMVTFGYADALAVLLVRALLGSFIAGGVSSLVYGLPAGIISLTLSFALYRTLFPRISIVAVSVAAATVHNIVQVLVFVLLNGLPQMLGYMPYLALIGAASGLFTGFTVYFLAGHMPAGAIRTQGE